MPMNTGPMNECRTPRLYTWSALLICLLAPLVLSALGQAQGDVGTLGRAPRAPTASASNLTVLLYP